MSKFCRKLKNTFYFDRLLRLMAAVICIIYAIYAVYAATMFVVSHFSKEPQASGQTMAMYKYIPQNSEETAEYNASQYQYFGAAGGYYAIKRTEEAEQAFAAEVWSEENLSTLFEREDEYNG